MIKIRRRGDMSDVFVFVFVYLARVMKPDLPRLINLPYAEAAAS